MYIDSHVHLRDFNEAYKETIRHGLEVARDAGVDAVFDMPNKNPAIITREHIVACLQSAKEANVPKVFYGLYIGVTKDPEQIKQAVAVTREFSQVVGIKFYADETTGDLGITEEDDQKLVYRVLAYEGYTGVLAVHCEKKASRNPQLWDPRNPISHYCARPEKAETDAVKDQITFATAAGFKGKLHITHISTPEAVDLVHAAKSALDISCGVCPHHLIYGYTQLCEENGILWKMNPALRSKDSKLKLVEQLKQGRIDWIETDHAPHSLEEKIKEPHCSGIPALPWWPMFDLFLQQQDLSDAQIRALTFDNVATRFGINITRTQRPFKDHRAEYAFDPYKKVAEKVGWPQ